MLERSHLEQARRRDCGLKPEARAWTWSARASSPPIPDRSRYQLIVEQSRAGGAGRPDGDAGRAPQDAGWPKGLFDAARKKKLPFLPDVIGVITSPTGAVIRDIMHRLEARFPRRVLLWPVAVQGEKAAAEIAAAIAGFNALRCAGTAASRSLIVARGGGDRWKT